MHAKLIHPGQKVDLEDIDPDGHGDLTKEKAERKIAKLGERMGELQELLFAARETSLLIVLQGRDTSGKDGTIRHLLKYVNVQSCRVASFKVPTALEAGHDFLWRVHAQTPARGDITIFNRSHYEDVLAARVHAPKDEKGVKKDKWKQRYAAINQFEELLHDSDTIILKFFLHISKDEQKERLLAREADPEKSWKLSVGDWKERELWDDYTKVYEDAIQKCSPKHAPWRIVPANHKWYRDLAIFQAIVEELEPYEKSWRNSLTELGAREREALIAFRNAK